MEKPAKAHGAVKISVKRRRVFHWHEIKLNSTTTTTCCDSPNVHTLCLGSWEKEKSTSEPVPLQEVDNQGKFFVSSCFPCMHQLFFDCTQATIMCRIDPNAEWSNTLELVVHMPIQWVNVVAAALDTATMFAHKKGALLIMVP
jgi:hypothetical protein